MERSGPSIEVKVVLLVLAAVGAQDLLLLGMYLSGARPTAIQIALGGLLILALVGAAVWGNALVRAIRRLSRACYVARHGDTRVLSELTRTDELGELNDEINRMVALLSRSEDTCDELALSGDVIEELERVAPEIMRSSHELLVSLKELREGAVAEGAILRKVSGCLGEAKGLVAGVAGMGEGRTAKDPAARLKSIGTLAREIDILGDSVVDEAARPSVDEGALARAVNGLRDASRTMAQLAAESAGSLERRSDDAEAALKAADRIMTAESEKTDGSRVAELMEQSAHKGLAEATRLTASLRKLGIALEAYAARKRTI
jgi:HAMP domain-containing protein